MTSPPSQDPAVDVRSSLSIRINFPGDERETGEISPAGLEAPIRMSGDCLDGTISFVGPRSFEYRLEIALKGSEPSKM